MLERGYRLIHTESFESKFNETATPQIQQKWLDGVKLFADRSAVLKEVGKRSKVAEVGVGFGDFSNEILKMLEPESFVAIDLFNVSPNGKWGEPLTKTKLSHKEYFEKQVASNLGQTHLEIMTGNSWECLAQVSDDFLDYIYIDADHKYSSVKKDLSTASQKVKVGGIIQCNDFTHFDAHNLVSYGVPRAVFELLEQGKFQMTHLCLHPTGFYDVVLKRIS